MDDLISRQVAIDALTEYGSGNDIYMSVRELKRRIETLPSAQPETLGMICGACDYCDSTVLYLTNPPQVKCKRSGKLHFVTDHCDAPSAQFKRINKGIHEITESDKISYAVICDKFPSPHIYFNTYGEAERWARFNQPTYRPYYIIERSEHFEIIGEVR